MKRTTLRVYRGVLVGFAVATLMLALFVWIYPPWPWRPRAQEIEFWETIAIALLALTLLIGLVQRILWRNAGRKGAAQPDLGAIALVMGSTSVALGWVALAWPGLLIVFLPLVTIPSGVVAFGIGVESVNRGERFGELGIVTGLSGFIFTVFILVALSTIYVIRTNP